MSKTNEVFEKLPERFDRQDVLQKAKEVGLSYSGASSVPDRLLYEEKIVRIDRGSYKKIKP